MFVPVFIPTQYASPHAQEMGRRIAALIRDYRLQHQDASATDVDFALRIAAAEEGGRARRRPIVMMVAMIVAMIIAGLLMFVRSGEGEPTFIILVLAGLIVVTLAVLMLIKSRLG